MGGAGPVRRLLMLAVSYVAGAVPFSNVFASRLFHVDLRRVGSGTVSGTSLYRVAGFKPLAVAGSLDVAKGALVVGLLRWSHRGRRPDGPAPADSGWRPPTTDEALAAGMVVVGHNWSPFLDGAGGRGISPALGAYGVIAPEGAVLLLSGLVIGRLTRQTGLGTFASQVALVPVLGATRGRRGALAGAAVLVPMLTKRVMGNGPARGRRVYLARLLYDRDEWVPR